MFIGGGDKADADGIYYFELLELNHAFAVTLERWLSTCNDGRGKFARFFECYDEITSGSKWTGIYILQLKNRIGLQLFKTYG